MSCSDSSTTGFGVSTSFWDRSVVSRCGRTLEGSRFRKLGLHSARKIYRPTWAVQQDWSKAVQLTGSNNKGIPYTQIAQPYPQKSCRSLAFVLTCITCKYTTTQNFGYHFKYLGNGSGESFPHHWHCSYGPWHLLLVYLEKLFQEEWGQKAIYI